MAKKPDLPETGAAPSAPEPSSTRPRRPRASEKEGPDGTTRVVVAEYDRYHMRLQAGESQNMWGHPFECQENGDMVCDMANYAVENSVEAGRVILASEHHPRKPASKEDLIRARKRGTLKVS